MAGSAKATTGRPVGGGRSSAENRAHILDAAEACFAEKGIEATTVADIAEEAGLSRSLVYRHFGGRDEIVVACLDRSGRRLLTAASTAYLGASTAAELLSNLLVEVVWLARTDPVLTASFGGADRDVASGILSASDLFISDADQFEAALREVAPHILGEFREGLSYADAVDFIRAIGVMLVNQPPVRFPTRDALRRWVENFVLPAVIADPPPIR